MSTNENQSTQPYEEYGMPGDTRREVLHRTQKEDATKPVTFKGEELNIPRQIVSIKLPKYRIKNGRTRTMQKQYLADNPEVRQDFFDRDDESNQVQEVQHTLLLELSGDADLKDYFTNPRNQQTEEIILDYDGFVVNGNRRLAFWRYLLKTDSQTYQHFTNIRIVRLPYTYDDKDIAKLEHDLQTAPDIKSSYAWHSEGEMFRHQMETFEMNETEYAAMTGKRPVDIRSRIQSFVLAERYLEQTRNTNRFSKVDDKEQSFSTLEKQAKSRKMQNLGPVNQDLLRDITFCLMDAQSGEGSDHTHINNLVSNFEEVVKETAEKLGVESGSEEENETGNELSPRQRMSDTDRRNQKLSNTINKWLSEPFESPGNASADQNSERVRAVVLEAIQKIKAQNREQASTTYLLDQIQKAHDILINAVTRGLNDRTGTEGVKPHLKEMEALIKQIEGYLGQNAEN